MAESTKHEAPTTLNPFKAAINLVKGTSENLLQTMEEATVSTLVSSILGTDEKINLAQQPKEGTSGQLTGKAEQLPMDKKPKETDELSKLRTALTDTENALREKEKQLTQLQKRYNEVLKIESELEMEANSSQSETRSLQERLALLSLKLAEVQDKSQTEEEILKKALADMTSLLEREKTNFGFTVQELTKQIVSERQSALELQAQIEQWKSLTSELKEEREMIRKNLLDEMRSNLEVMEKEKQREVSYWKDLFYQSAKQAKELEELNAQLRGQLESELQQPTREAPQEQLPRQIPIQLEGERQPEESEPISLAQREFEKVDQLGNMESKEEENFVPEIQKEEWGIGEKPREIVDKEEWGFNTKEETQPLLQREANLEVPKEDIAIDIPAAGPQEQPEEQPLEQAEEQPLEQPLEEQEKEVPAEEEHEINTEEKLKELKKNKRHPARAVMAGGRRFAQAAHPHIPAKRPTLVEQRDEKRAAEILGDEAKSTETALAKAEHQAQLVKKEENLHRRYVKSEVTKNRNNKVFPSTYFPPQKPAESYEKNTQQGPLFQYTVPQPGRMN
jgi:hypothetical protein